jgi:lysine 2,3-aminomutase
VVCPMRITEDVARLLRKYKPVYFMTHFNHPRELSSEAAESLERLVDHGVPTFNQMVLLNGINNHVSIVQALARRLLFLRVKPYYMFQCDPSEGSEHFRTSMEQSQAIQREMWGRLSGLATANLSMDIPGGGGKVGLVPDFEVSRESGVRHYRGWDGVTGEYREPQSAQPLVPPDVATYLQEWETLRDQPYGAK